MRIAALDKVQLHWREDGAATGPAVVFANSLGTDFRLWDKIIPLLPQEYRLVRFDNRGHGLSSCPDGPYSIDDLTDDTEGLLDHLGIKSCVFVGLSIGGLIAQNLAARRPDLLRAMVLSNTGAKIGDTDLWEPRIQAVRRDGIDGSADGILLRWFSERFRQSTELMAWRNMLTRTPQAGYVACCQAIAAADLAGSTAKLRLPTLGIAGSQDYSTPPELVQNTTALIPGSRFAVIDGVGHLPCVEAPDKFAGLLTAFFKEVGDV